MNHRSTTYVAEAYTASLPPGVAPPSPDTATRAGSFALLIYAIVSLAAGTLLPYLTTLGTSFPSLPSRVGRIGRWVLCALSLRNLWTFSLGWFAACMGMTFWVESVRGTTTVVALVGVSWAVTCWVRFLLRGSFPRTPRQRSGIEALVERSLSLKIRH